MKKLIYLFIMLICLSPIMVHAVFIEVDLNTAGDTLITRDTETGLDWLDLSATINFSYEEILIKLQQDEQYKGFRYADMAEIETLWHNAGIFDFSNTYVPENFLPIKNFIPLIGATSSFGVFSIGIYGEQTMGGYQRTASLQYWDDIQSGKANLIYNGILPTLASSSHGSYLVKEQNTVPEPSTFILIISGLFLSLVRKINKVRRSYFIL